MVCKDVCIDTCVHLTSKCTAECRTNVLPYWGRQITQNQFVQVNNNTAVPLYVGSFLFRTIHVRPGKYESAASLLSCTLLVLCFGG